MTEEPDFLSQTGEDLNDETKRRAWMKARVEEASGQGATWHRFSISENPPLLLHEAWKVRPKDQGEPRFQLVDQGYW